VGITEQASSSAIGGPSAALQNIIAYTSGGPGVWVTDLRNHGSPTGIRIQGNSIHDNATLGIELGGTFPFPSSTPNSNASNDAANHVGPNNLENFPVLSAASSTGTDISVSGTFSQPNQPGQTITLDFYGNTNPAHLQADGHYYGEGQTWLGSATVTTDAGGNATFAVDLPGGGPAPPYISATATDPGGNTSEFSADVPVSAGTFAQQLQAALPQSTTSPNAITVQASPGTIDTVVAALSPSNLGQQVTAVSVYLNLTPGTYTQQTVQVPAGMTLYINGTPGTTIDPDLPAFTVVSGNVVVSNVTFVTTGDAPTILVSGGHLTLRNDVIQESTGSNQAAIQITGGTVDLGKAGDPGNNTININGTGTFVRNTTANPVSAVGDTFEVNGQATAWPIPLTVTTSSSLMLVGNSPPPLTGSVNGTPFTGAIAYTTAFGDTVTVTLSTAATSASPVGQYAITASLSGADSGNYVIDPASSTTGTMYVVSVGADPSSSTGAEAVTFWDTKGNARLITAADLSSLDALNLVNQGGAAFDPRAVAQLQAWLSTPPNATAAYQLAVQLAVMDLNVLTGYVQATDLVYAGGLLAYATADNIVGLTSGGFIDVQHLMQAANAALGQVSPGAPSGDPNQAYELALAQVLQAANGNTDFVRQELLWNLFALYPSLIGSA
jgi:hypothetical protein